MDKIVSTTIAWIENDMGRKEQISPRNAGPPISPQPVSFVKQEFAHHQPHAQGHPLAPNGDGLLPPQSGGGGPGYYGATLPSQAPSYPQLAYQDQPGVGGGPSNGMSYDAAGNPTYLYPSAGSTGVAASQSSPGGGHTPASNALVDFASQATGHLSGQMGNAFMAQGSAWHDWTAAIADNQDRYSANALLNLHATPRRDSIDAMPGGDAAVQNQWPLLLFHVGTGAVSGA